MARSMMQMLEQSPPLKDFGTLLKPRTRTAQDQHDYSHGPSNSSDPKSTDREDAATTPIKTVIPEGKPKIYNSRENIPDPRGSSKGSISTDREDAAVTTSKTVTPEEDRNTGSPVKEKGFLDRAGEYISGVSKQAGELYGKHSGVINTGLATAALGGLGYAAYKKLKNDRAAKKANAKMLA